MVDLQKQLDIWYLWLLILLAENGWENNMWNYWLALDLSPSVNNSERWFYKLPTVRSLLQRNDCFTRKKNECFSDTYSQLKLELVRLNVPPPSNVHKMDCFLFAGCYHAVLLLIHAKRSALLRWDFRVDVTNRGTQPQRVPNMMECFAWDSLPSPHFLLEVTAGRGTVHTRSREDAKMLSWKTAGRQPVRPSGKLLGW